MAKSQNNHKSKTTAVTKSLSKKYKNIYLIIWSCRLLKLIAVNDDRFTITNKTYNALFKELFSLHNDY